MEGWIKLYRNIMESRTFAKLSAIQKLIAVYIILNANHKDGIWIDRHRGTEVPIKRGQLITSRQKIVDEWFKKDKDVTEQKVRTALTKLEKLEFLTIESTNWYTLVNVVNYEHYQALDDEDNQQDNQALTSPQPSHNQALTTNKNEKNVKNEKNKDKKTSSRQPKTYAEDSPPYRMAVYLHSKIMEHAEANGKGHLVRNAKLQSWANECRKLLELDGRDKAEIRAVIDWATKDPFWQTNILSPEKLRKHYAKLCMEKDKTGNIGRTPKSRGGLSDKELQELEAEAKGEQQR